MQECLLTTHHAQLARFHIGHERHPGQRQDVRFNLGLKASTLRGL